MCSNNPAVTTNRSEARREETKILLLALAPLRRVLKFSLITAHSSAMAQSWQAPALIERSVKSRRFARRQVWCHPPHAQQRELRLARDQRGADLPGTAMLLVEIGADMSIFGSAERLASWVRICAGNYESARSTAPLQARPPEFDTRRRLSIPNRSCSPIKSTGYRVNS